MACLLRQSLRRNIHRFPFQQRLLSTSISGSSDPNSNYDFPSLLREVSEAIKQLDFTGAPFIFSFPSSFNSKQACTDEQLHLHKKLEQLRVKSVNFTHWYDDVFLKFDKDSAKTREDFHHEILKNDSTRDSLYWVNVVRLAITGQTFLPPKDQKLLVYELGTLIISYKRLKEMMEKDSEISEAHIKSVLACLEEIIKDFAEIRKDLHQDDLWNELNNGLMRRKEIELEQAEAFAKQVKNVLDHASERIEHFSESRRDLTGLPYE